MKIGEKYVLNHTPTAKELGAYIAEKLPLEGEVWTLVEIDMDMGNGLTHRFRNDRDVFGWWLNPNWFKTELKPDRQPVINIALDVLLMDKKRISQRELTLIQESGLGNYRHLTINSVDKPGEKPLAVWAKSVLLELLCNKNG